MLRCKSKGAPTVFCLSVSLTLSLSVFVRVSCALHDSLLARHGWFCFFSLRLSGNNQEMHRRTSISARHLLRERRHSSRRGAWHEGRLVLLWCFLCLSSPLPTLCCDPAPPSPPCRRVCTAFPSWLILFLCSVVAIWRMSAPSFLPLAIGGSEGRTHPQL